MLSHLPFYTVLLPKFLELTYGRLGFRSDAAVSDALLVLEVGSYLTSSKLSKVITKPTLTVIWSHPCYPPHSGPVRLGPRSHL